MDGGGTQFLSVCRAHTVMYTLSREYICDTITVREFILDHDEYSGHNDVTNEAPGKGPSTFTGLD